MNEMPPFWSWLFWNSQLWTTIIGALIFSIIVSVIVARISHGWGVKRKRFEFQLETFGRFNDVSGEVIFRLTELYHSRFSLSPEQFQNTKREVILKKLAFLNMDAQIQAAFRDESLFDDLLKVKGLLTEFDAGIQHQKSETPLKKVESIQKRYIWQTKIMKMKMMREMGTIKADQYSQGIRRLQDLIDGKIEEG